MTYLITALDAEARALIDYYGLKRDMSLPYTLYKNTDILLLICGVGKTNAMMAVSALLGWRIPHAGDTLINIGICAAPTHYEIGEALLIHQLIDTHKTYYPDILYTHTLKESSILCVDTPQSIPNNLPVDMESTAVFCAASRFFKLHQMAFLKIVSDHFEPDCVSKESAISLIHAHLHTLDTLIANLAYVSSTPPLFTKEEGDSIQKLKGYFTKSQGDALEDALCFFRLRYPAKSLPLEIEEPTSKRERSMVHEHLIQTLVS